MRNPAKLFEPCTVMGIHLPNRFIRSATLEGLAGADGEPTPQLTRLCTDLAGGGVGIISTSACLADQNWVPSSIPFLSLHSDQTLSSWEDTVRAVHHSGALISVQLAPFFLVDGKPVGLFAYNEGIKPLSVYEIGKLVALYARAASRAKKVGADAVQVHGGHGYPLSQFLSPFYNRREDEYGGAGGRCRGTAVLAYDLTHFFRRKSRPHSHEPSFYPRAGPDSSMAVRGSSCRSMPVLQ